jgi:hypothetical protein
MYGILTALIGGLVRGVIVAAFSIMNEDFGAGERS